MGKENMETAMSGGCPNTRDPPKDKIDNLDKWIIPRPPSQIPSTLFSKCADSNPIQSIVVYTMMLDDAPIRVHIDIRKYDDLPECKPLLTVAGILFTWSGTGEERHNE